MHNPFEDIINRLERIEKLLLERNEVPLKEAIEIIDTDELIKRLNISNPTIIKWRDKGKIPFFKIGTAIRYDWNKVVLSLEKASK